jgi:ketosteroid isomerase-like protein
MKMEQKDLQSPDEIIKAIVREFHKAIEEKDVQRMGELVLADIFVFGAATEAISIGRDQFVTHLNNLFLRAEVSQLCVLSLQIEVGLCDSDRSAWFLDRFVVEIMGDQETPQRFPIRFTGLLVRDQGWHLAAAYWSIPLRDNEYQYSLLENGKIQKGIALEDHVTPEARALAQILAKVMDQPSSMPELYATREDAFTIGSTVEEVFHAAEGKNWVQEIVQLPLQFAVRGGIRGAVAPDGCMAWLATHIDLSGGLTVPYRFFYIWLREQDEWKIVVSHDAVSIDPIDPGFDVP